MSPNAPRTSAIAAVFASLAPLVGLGCGDAARGLDYVGEPLLTRRCALYIDDPTLRDEPLYLGVAWFAADGQAPHTDDTALTASLDGTLDAHVITPAPVAALRSWPGLDGQVALGQLVVWRDLDGDGTWRADADEVVGTDAPEGIAWAPSGLRSDAFGALSAGYHALATASCAAGAPTFSGLAAPDACILSISPKFAPLLVDACAWAPGPCDDLAALRATCAAEPDEPACAKCSAGVFPAGATPAECDAWEATCRATFDPAQCASEAAICKG